MFTWRHFRFIGIGFYPFLAERERTRVPDVIFARLDRGRAEEKRAAAEGFPVVTSVCGGRNWTVPGSSSVKRIIVDSARERSLSLVLSVGLLTQGAAVGRRSGIRKVIGLAERLELPVLVRKPRL